MWYYYFSGKGEQFRDKRYIPIFSRERMKILDLELDDSRQDFSLSFQRNDSKLLIVVKEKNCSLLRQSVGYDFSIPSLFLRGCGCGGVCLEIVTSHVASNFAKKLFPSISSSSFLPSFLRFHDPEMCDANISSTLLMTLLFLYTKDWFTLEELHPVHSKLLYSCFLFEFYFLYLLDLCFRLIYL